MTAPARNLIKLPAEVSFEVGARFGYLGTAYIGSWVGVLITLGVTISAMGCLLALTMLCSILLLIPDRDGH